MPPQDAVALENWFPGTSYVEIRGGNSDHFTGLGARGSTLATYNALSGTNKMFCSTASAIFSVGTAGASGNWLNLPGAAGDYASTPDSAAASVTGDIDLRFVGAATDWDTGGLQMLIAKQGGVGQYAYTFYLNGASLNLFISVDGTAISVATSSVNVTAAVNGSTYGLRAVRTAASGNVVFYTSADSGATWTALGTTQATTAGNLFDGTAVLEIGSRNTGTDPFNGKVYSALIYSGATLKTSFDPDDGAASVATVVSSATGETYTVQGNATIMGPQVVVGITNGKWQWVNMGNGTNNYLIMVNGVDSPRYYNGTAWVAVTGASSPALTGLTTTSIIGVFVSKGRLYFIEKESLSIWYLAAGAVGGALTEFDLSAVAKKGGYLMAGATWTVDAGDGPDDRIVLMTSEGEAIVYAGTNPGSATAWALVGVYDIGRPIGRRCMQKLGGDLVVITQNGAFPLSAALQSATIDYRLALSFKIEPAFTETARTYGATFGWEATLFPGRSALLVNVPKSEGGEHEQYVMNTLTKAWCKFTEWDAETFVVFNGLLYFTTGTKVVKGWTGTMDGTSDIVAYGKTAFSYFGRKGLLKQFKMFRPVLAVNGNLNFLTDVDVDFNDAPLTGTATYTATSGGLWDSALWDVGLWGGGLDVVKEWTSPAQYTGYCAAAKIKVATNSLTVRWMASDFVYEYGGPLG